MDTTKVNVNPVERRVSTLLGGVLLLRSFDRRSFGEAILAIPLLYRGVTGHSYLYQALGMNTANANNQSEARRSDDALEVERSLTIEKPADELHRLWRDPQSLSQIMQDFVEVTAGSENRLHWKLRGPSDRHMEWDTQIVEDQPGKILRWKSLDGAPILNEGSLYFRPAPRDWGTEVTLRFHFAPPGGTIDNHIAKSLGIIPRVLVEKALRGFKSLAETGEIPTLKRNPAARVDAYAEYAYAR